MRSRMFATTLVGMALVLAGCGGDDEETTSSTPATQSTTAVATVTKAEYITQADAICKTANAAGEQATNAAVQALGTEEPTPEQLATIATDIVLPNLEQQVTALKALPKPEADAAEIDALYADLDSGIAAAKEDPSVLTGGDAAEGPFKGANEKAVAFGMKECGSE